MIALPCEGNIHDSKSVTLKQEHRINMISSVLRQTYDIMNVNVRCQPEKQPGQCHFKNDCQHIPKDIKTKPLL
jgi:hypothetical protein